MLKIYAVTELKVLDVDDNYDNICKSILFVKTRGNLKFLRKFHDFLQISTSHYTLEEESSERLMLKYYEYLLRTKAFLKAEYSLEVLENLDKFPINTDSTLKKYQEKIAEKVNWHSSADQRNTRADIFYIHKIKPFFVSQKIYYEVTFTPASEKASKFDRVIAFTTLDISRYYAVRLSLIDDTINILGQTMSIFIIINWENVDSTMRD
ncbi:hypothetical protein [Methylocucumis oryzae]|uniref:hypothetical protein n=1 Tax=Methylocucumis oryzae TaxID=1632867 RepID=UPI0019553439|nr:hypothetical protein [Methylocucumis oryzae]